MPRMGCFNFLFRSGIDILKGIEFPIQFRNEFKSKIEAINSVWLNRRALPDLHVLRAQLYMYIHTTLQYKHYSTKYCTYNTNCTYYLQYHLYCPNVPPISRRALVAFFFRPLCGYPIHPHLCSLLPPAAGVCTAAM